MQMTADRWATQVFVGRGFTPEGQPPSVTPPNPADPPRRLPQTTIDQAVARYHYDKATAFRIDDSAATAFYENPTHTIIERLAAQEIDLLY